MNTELGHGKIRPDAEPQSPDHKAGPKRKKPFIKPELKQRETLPEVTTAFVGTFSP